MALRPMGMEREGTTAMCRLLIPAACSAVRMTLPLLGSSTTSSAPRSSTACSSCAALGFMDWPPSTTAWQPSSRKRALLPSPATTATTTVPGSSCCCRRSSRARVCSCMSLISISPMAPCLSASVSTSPGSLVCTCTLTRRSSPTTRALSPMGCRKASKTSALRPSPLMSRLVQYLKADSSVASDGGAGAGGAPPARLRSVTRAVPIWPRLCVSSAMPSATPRNSTSRP